MVHHKLKGGFFMAKYEQVKSAIEKYFDKNKFHYDSQLMDNGWSLISAFESNAIGINVLLVMNIHSDTNSITVAASGGTEAEKDKYNDINKLLTEANRRIKRGAYTINSETLDVSFRIWHPTNRGKFEEKDITNLLTLSIGSLELLWPWIKAVAEDKVSPMEAIEGYTNQTLPQFNDTIFDNTEEAPITLQNAEGI